jgi:hypothetical protein
VQNVILWRNIMVKTIEDLEKLAEQQEFEMLVRQDNSYEALKSLFSPQGFRPRFQISIPTKDGFRKKRRTADASTYNPGAECIIVSFEPILEEEESNGAATGPTEANAPGLSSQASNTGQLPVDQVGSVIRLLSQFGRPPRPFVGLKYFRDKVLPSLKTEWAEDDAQRRAMLEYCITQGIIITGRVPNPQAPEYPVTTIRLDHQHPMVMGMSPVENFDFQPVNQRGELASKMILRERR